MTIQIVQGGQRVHRTVLKLALALTTMVGSSTQIMYVCSVVIM